MTKSRRVLPPHIWLSKDGTRFDYTFAFYGIYAKVLPPHIWLSQDGTRFDYTLAVYGITIFDWVVL